MTYVFKVHEKNHLEVAALLRRTADSIEAEGRVFVGSIDQPLNVLLGKDTALVEISEDIGEDS